LYLTAQAFSTRKNVTARQRARVKSSTWLRIAVRRSVRRPGIASRASSALAALKYMQASFTPAEGAGSARFSSNLRERASYAGHSWAIRDRPWWMPEAVAKILFDSMDLSPAMAMCCLLAALGIVVAVLHTVTSLVVDEFRHRRSSRAARQLIEEEKAKKAAAAAQQQQQQQQHSAVARESGSAAGSEEPTGLTAMKRFCRFCDVQVEDEHMESHEAGKKHRKLRAAAEALANGSTCWTWRPVPMPVAAVADPGGTDAAEGHAAPSAAAGSTGGKVKGQSTKWSKVPAKPGPGGGGARRR
jgi:hypothetical protein